MGAEDVSKIQHCTCVGTENRYGELKTSSRDDRRIKGSRGAKQSLLPLPDFSRKIEGDSACRVRVTLSPPGNLKILSIFAVILKLVDSINNGISKYADDITISVPVRRNSDTAVAEVKNLENWAAKN